MQKFTVRADTHKRAFQEPKKQSWLAEEDCGDAETLRVPRSNLKKSWNNKPSAGGNKATTIKSWIANSRGTSGHGPKDITEEILLTNSLLESVYKRELDDTSAVAVLDACPELFWLVECFVQTPLPPGWRRSKVAPGDTPLYCKEDDGSVTETSPVFQYYCHLAETAVHMCYSTMPADQAQARIDQLVTEVTMAARDMQSKWCGPFKDPETKATFYHCPSSGVSSYDDPSGWSVFLRHVSESLLTYITQSHGDDAMGKDDPLAGNDRRQQQRQLRRQDSEEDTITISPRFKDRNANQSAASIDRQAISMADRIAGIKDDRIRDKKADSPKDPWAALDGLDGLLDKSILRNESSDAWCAMEKLIASENQKLPRTGASENQKLPRTGGKKDRVEAALDQLEADSPTETQAARNMGNVGETAAASDDSEEAEVEVEEVAPKSTFFAQKGGKKDGRQEDPMWSSDWSNLGKPSATHEDASKQPAEDSASKEEVESLKAKVSSMEEMLMALKSQLKSQPAEQVASTNSAPPPPPPIPPADDEREDPADMVFFEHKVDPLAQEQKQPGGPAPPALPSRLRPLPGVGQRSADVAGNSKEGGAAPVPAPSPPPPSRPAPSPPPMQASRLDMGDPSLSSARAAARHAEAEASDVADPSVSSASAGVGAAPANKKKAPLAPLSLPSGVSGAGANKNAKPKAMGSDQGSDPGKQNVPTAPLSLPPAPAQRATAKVGATHAPGKVAEQPTRDLRGDVADDLSGWAADTPGADAARQSKAAGFGDLSRNQGKASAPEVPVRRVELEGDIADDLEGWAADVDHSAARIAGVTKAPPAGSLKAPVPQSNAPARKFAPVVKKEVEEDVLDAAEELLRATSLEAPDANAKQVKPQTSDSPRPQNNVAVEPTETPDLNKLVARLRNLPVQESAHQWDRNAIVETLEAIEKIPLTVDDLRETQLGILTQAYKDSPDQQVKLVARRLRKNWKALITPS